MQIVRVAHWILSFLMILLGTIHSLMAFHCRDLDEGTLWFLGAGIAIIFAGLFNVLFLLINATPVRIITLIVNIVVTGLFVFALKVLFGSQVYIGIALFGISSILVLYQKKIAKAQ